MICLNLEHRPYIFRSHYNYMLIFVKVYELKTVSLYINNLR